MKRRYKVEVRATYWVDGAKSMKAAEDLAFNHVITASNRAALHVVRGPWVAINAVKECNVQKVEK